MRDILANELRIGNFVRLNIYGHDHEDDYCKITGITEENLRVNVVDFDHLEPQEVEPIPLTEDWLVKFGMELPINIEDIFDSSKVKYEKPFNPFRKTSQSLIDATYDFFGLDLYNDSTGFWIRILEDFTHLKHVHHLQNLYFALTGQELTLTP